MVPKDRATFKEFCLRKLGKPVIEINIDDDQLDDRVDEALRYFYDYHFDGTERIYLRYQIQTQDITNRYITLPDNIIGAVEIFPIGSALNINNMFSIRYQISLNDLYTLSSVSMIPYVMEMTHLQWLEQILVGKQPIRYNRNANILYVDQDWTLLNAGDFIIVHAFQVVNPDVYKRAWSDYWLQEYCCALIKLNYGTNTSKFESLPMPGGMKFSGQRWKEEAYADKLRIEKEIRDSSLPASDMIG